MDVTFRPATKEDIPDLSRLHLMAAHGLFDALFHDTIPGLSTNEIYERVLARPEAFWSYTSVTVATHEGRIVGEVHSLPYDEIDETPSEDPLIPKDRLGLYEPFERLHPLASGSYYINILAVYPEYRSKGIGSQMMDLARSRATQLGFSRLSLHSFDDPRAIALYQRLGFTVAGRSPLVEHEMLQFPGDLLLLTRSI
jgi:ribosomal protein S18 acetylase RimI-like enzyme